MLEYAVGVGIAAALGTATAIYDHRNRTSLVGERRFRRQLHLLAPAEGPRHCGNCKLEVGEMDARVIYARPDGRVGVICNRTECLLAYAHNEVPVADPIP